MSKTVYLIGSLRNPEIPNIGNALREKLGYDVFDDWFAGGKIADDEWQAYETSRGHSYADALRGIAADHVFSFDKYHLDRADVGVLVLPAGKSGHLELGYLAGQGKRTYILFDKVPERWDVMYKFATNVAFSLKELMEMLYEDLRERHVHGTGETARAGSPSDQAGALRTGIVVSGGGQARDHDLARMEPLARLNGRS